MPDLQPDAEPELLIRESGSVLHITLNRPRAVNALSPEMCSQLAHTLEGVDGQGFSAVLLDGSGDRGFCGGGDVKRLRLATEQGAREFLTNEYRADLLTNTLKTPVVGFMTGITMGGGIGLTGHAAVRIVTEDSRLAMPETKIGLSPDVGGDVLLARAPGRIGEYLATTSANFGPGDAIATGFADVFVPRSALDELKRELLTASEHPRETVARFSAAPPPGTLIDQRGWIDASFELNSVVDALHHLESRPEPEAHDAARMLREVSPISVAVSFWAVRLAKRGDDLPTVLERDLRVLLALLDRYDAREGIRSVLVDKDFSPRWQPAQLEDVTVAQVVDVLGAEVLEVMPDNRV